MQGTRFAISQPNPRPFGLLICQRLLLPGGKADAV
jgi:hypothetical protein